VRTWFVAPSASAAQPPLATATAPGAVQLAGDLGGTGTTPRVTWLQGYALASTAPTANQVLTWNGTAWAPATPSGGAGTAAAGASGNGTSGLIAEWTGTSALGNSPITDASGTVTSSEPLAAPSLTTTGTGTPTVQLGTSGPSWTSGTGAPTSACVVGSLYSRLDGAVGSTLYVCEAPSGTWGAK
jgi:hypothetical protein